MSVVSESAGTIQGESQVPAMRGWIEVEDWQWSLRASGEAGEHPEPSVLTVSKRMDRSSTALLTAMDQGSAMTVTLRMEEASLEMMSLSIRLEQARFTSYRLDLEDEDSAAGLMEDWDIDYRLASFEYRADRQSGVITTSLVRLAGASVEAPDAPQRELLKLAGRLSVRQLEEVWDEMLAESRRRAGLSGDSSDKEPTRRRALPPSL
ncbi:type VI secretion system tube protein Hcp [Aquabacterium sp. A7-Y]|uniref:type VI secretion system tube protein Hcp n=1 Tax=Aquabacterium sp. A7-Y TaxID=1349605 RepID=UPI00223E8671|nr:type VI secretion system tube protein Hcp [Aquabacterium sp. A7-Y]MCW7539700.1 type VI secretion system tube protein Hcp [Aquabacterium sp. A7-Y]